MYSPCPAAVEASRLRYLTSVENCSAYCLSVWLSSRHWCVYFRKVQKDRETTANSGFIIHVQYSIVHYLKTFNKIHWNGEKRGLDSFLQASGTWCTRHTYWLRYRIVSTCSIYDIRRWYEDSGHRVFHCRTVGDTDELFFLLFDWTWSS